jgi:hypothetical protein
MNVTDQIWSDIVSPDIPGIAGNDYARPARGRLAAGRRTWPARGRLGLAAAAAAAAVAASLLAVALPASAAGPQLRNPRIVAHLDFGHGQTPENIALEPDGSAAVTFAEAAQVASVSPDGRVRVLAQLPKPTAGAACPVIGPALNAPAFTLGIARAHNGVLFVAYCTGSADLQGIWRVGPNGSARRIAALPADGIPNGMALDERHGFLYVADSLLSVVWRVSIANGTAVKWAAGPQLAPNGFLGANGLKLHDGAVYVSNTQLGTLLRIPVRRNGSAGPIGTAASGLAGIDDFAFTGPAKSSPAIAALNGSSQVDLIAPDGAAQAVLTAANGLSNPTSVAVRANTVYINSAAYVTQTDPNLLLATLHR